MQEWLLQMFTEHQYLVYAIIVFICFVEGPILMILCGILIRIADLPILPLYLALMIGDLIGDVAWYWLGRKIGHPFVRRFGKYFSIEEKEITAVTKIFQKYHTRILIISKITMGFGFATVTLFTAGLSHISFKKYLILNTIGQIVWTAFLLSVGYLFGHWYTLFNDVLGKISLATLVIIAIIAIFGYGKYVKKCVTEKIS